MDLNPNDRFDATVERMGFSAFRFILMLHALIVLLKVLLGF